MRVREIMTKNVVVLAPDAPVREIARMFRSQGITGAPVMQGDELIGLVTQRDLISRHARPHSPLYLPLLGAQIPLAGQEAHRALLRRILGTTAQDIMTRPAPVIDADADLEDLATLMIEEGVNPVPVIEQGRLVGIVSHADVVQALEEAKEPADD